MPEGDTIHRSARRLSAALAGRSVVSVDLPRSVVDGPPAGTVIEAVVAEGKFLMIRFDDGSELETHLKMNGSWSTARRRGR